MTIALLLSMKWGSGRPPPEKKFDFNEAKSCNFRKFGTKHSLLKESIDSLFL